MLGTHKEITGPVIGVDVSGFPTDFDTNVVSNLVDDTISYQNTGTPGKTGNPGKTQYKSMVGIGSSSYKKATLNSLDLMLGALGMPPLEHIILDTINDPDSYITCVIGITFKGKNRTFKNKVSRKRVLHKVRRLDEFNIAMNAMRRWI